MITCTQCHKELNISFFMKNEKILKRCYFCRDYVNSRQKIDRKNNPEKYKAIQEKYKKSNLEKIRERDKKFHANYRRNNYEEYRAKRKLYDDNNREKISARDHKRMIDRPEYFLFSSARQRARKYNMEFNISEKDIKTLLENTDKCPLRGVAFEKGHAHKASDNSISLDRIDSSLGYTVNNVQILSYLANIVKNNIGYKVFEKIVKNLKTYKPLIHNIDDITRKIIIEDRLNQIKLEDNINNRHYRIMNVEKYLLNSANKRAKKNNLEIDIDESYIKSIWPIDNMCPILKEKFKYGKSIVLPLSATIDRINNKKGYVKGNVMILSYKVNAIKNKCSLEELELMKNNWGILEKKKESK